MKSKTALERVRGLLLSECAVTSVAFGIEHDHFAQVGAGDVLIHPEGLHTPRLVGVAGAGLGFKLDRVPAGMPVEVRSRAIAQLPERAWTPALTANVRFGRTR
jgi:hypothetical protein